MERGGYVYILTNKRHTTLYVGLTSDLLTRICQHKTYYYPNSFTAKYDVTKLVYYQFYSRIDEAIEVEKLLKAGPRKNKQKLINIMNPEWKDLYESVFAEEEE